MGRKITIVLISLSAKTLCTTEHTRQELSLRTALLGKKTGINHLATLIRLNWTHFPSLVLLFALHIYHFAPATPNSLLPCHSVCLNVHFNCIHHFKSICLPWQQELTYTRKPVQELTKFNPILYGQRATS